ncbi:MAG TPA: nuclear transport factor 2 family protein [Ferruginibacter sp.]|nr:nuclear transport factor 2 family protein [Ferruginibacter sp.]
MSENKKIVKQYMDGFVASDHEKILSCLTDDVIWEMPGFFYLTGKEAFDKEIENDNFTGSPSIQITRMVEENDIVVAEGAVQAKIKAGGDLDAVFCDVFHMQDGRIKKLTTYLMNKKK